METSRPLPETEREALPPNGTSEAAGVKAYSPASAWKEKAVTLLGKKGFDLAGMEGTRPQPIEDLTVQGQAFLDRERERPEGPGLSLRPARLFRYVQDRSFDNDGEGLLLAQKGNVGDPDGHFPGGEERRGGDGPDVLQDQGRREVGEA